MSDEDVRAQIQAQEDLEKARVSAVRRMRYCCERDILERAPAHKQQNAALGLLPTPEIEVIKGVIQENRQKLEVLEYQISKMSSIDDLLRLQWGE